MIDFSGEVALGSSEGVVSGEGDAQEEHTSGIWTVIRTDNGSLPVKLIIGVSGAS